MGTVQKDREYRRSYRERNKEAVAAQITAWNHTPRGRYKEQRANANRREIPWEFTFEEWWAMWEPHWAHRGRGLGDMCMCRESDEGPYSPSNTRIDTVTNNHNERTNKCIKAMA